MYKHQFQKIFNLQTRGVCFKPLFPATNFPHGVAAVPKYYHTTTAIYRSLDDPFPFSKSSSHPSRMEIQQNVVDVESKEKDSEEKVSRKIFRIVRKQPIAVFIYSVMTVVAFNWFFLSDYDLDAEELFIKTIPGYEEQMMALPKYRNSMKRLREERAKKNEETFS